MINRNSERPLYQQLYETFKLNIRDGNWTEQLPPETELCETYNVSRGTLRQALSLLEADGYLSRERGRGTFINQDNNFNQAPSVVSSLAFIVPYVRGSFVTSILAGIEQATTEAGHPLIFRHVSNNLEQQVSALQDLKDGMYGGVILYPIDSIHHEQIKQLAEQGFPIILVDRYFHGIDTDYVVADNFGGGLQATQHLLSLGHRRIGFITWDDAASSLQHREMGYRQAMTEYQLPISDTLIAKVSSYPDIDTTPLATYLQENNITAIVAANDQIAIALFRLVNDMGLSVPDDISIVGFGNLEEIAYLNTPLTTVSIPAEDIGYTAGKLLIDRLHNQNQTPQRIILPTQLMVRGSTKRNYHD